MGDKTFKPGDELEKCEAFKQLFMKCSDDQGQKVFLDKDDVEEIPV